MRSVTNYVPDWLREILAQARAGTLPGSCAVETVKSVLRVT
jgi:hypothetical protein